MQKNLRPSNLQRVEFMFEKNKIVFEGFSLQRRFNASYRKLRKEILLHA